MAQEELLNQIANLEREIAILPEGSITKKKTIWWNNESWRH